MHGVLNFITLSRAVASTFEVVRSVGMAKLHPHAPHDVPSTQVVYLMKCNVVRGRVMQLVRDVLCRLHRRGVSCRQSVNLNK